MNITEKQKDNIYKMSNENLLEILDIIKERLGIVSRKEYKAITGYKPTMQYMVTDIRNGNIKSVKIGGKRLPYINT